MTQRVDPHLAATLDRVGLRYREYSDGSLLILVHWEDDGEEKTQLLYSSAEPLTVGGQEFFRIAVFPARGRGPGSKVLAYCLESNGSNGLAKWALHTKEEGGGSLLEFQTLIEANLDADGLKTALFAIAEEVEEAERYISNLERSHSDMNRSRSRLALWWASRINQLKHLWHDWRGNRYQSSMLVFRQQELDDQRQRARQQDRGDAVSSETESVRVSRAKRRKDSIP